MGRKIPCKWQRPQRLTLMYREGKGLWTLSWSQLPWTNRVKENELLIQDHQPSRLILYWIPTLSKGPRMWSLVTSPGSQAPEWCSMDRPIHPKWERICEETSTGENMTLLEYQMTTSGKGSSDSSRQKVNLLWKVSLACNSLVNLSLLIAAAYNTLESASRLVGVTRRIQGAAALLIAYWHSSQHPESHFVYIQ